MKQSRELNIVKALCIILMVIGHTDAPAGLTGFIYLFHMPAFFFLSGWLFKEAHLEQPILYIKKKLGSLYVPYVFWELLFLLLSGLFFRLHLTDVHYTLQEGLAQAFKYVTFRGHQPLLNAYWFLKTLFFTAVGCLILLRVVKRGRWLLVVGMLVAAGCCRLVPYETTMISRLFLACAFYLTGYLCAKRPIRFPVWPAVLCLCAVAGISLFYRGNIFVDGWEVALYYPVALLGTYGIFGLSRWLDRFPKLAAGLDTMGRSTLTIMTFHFLSFKLVALIEILVFHLSIDRLAEFPVIHDHIAFSWPLYAAFGLALPVCIYLLHKRVHPKDSGIVKLF